MIVPKRSNHTPPSLPSDRTSSPIHPSSRARVFGWLLPMINSLVVIEGHGVSYFRFFKPLQIDTRFEEITPPTRSALAASPLQRPPYRRRQLISDCCVPQLHCGQLRPMVLPSLYFFRRSICRPKRRATVLPRHTNPATSPLHHNP